MSRTKPASVKPLRNKPFWVLMAIFAFIAVFYALNWYFNTTFWLDGKLWFSNSVLFKIIESKP